MKHNLGKLLIILFFPYILYGQVKLEVANKFYKGEVVKFTIIVSGGDIKIPSITNIDGITVHSTATSTKTTIINGVRSYIFSKSYSFIPQNDITIPSFKIKVDNKIEKTKPHKLVMLKIKKTISPYYDLEIKVDKTDGYVGEGIVFDLNFKYRKDLSVVGLEFNRPDFNNFWVKELKNDQQQIFNSEYIYQKLTYLLFPQQSGKLTIGPLKIGLVSRENIYSNNFFLSSSTKTTPVYSNIIKLDIKKLPSGVKLIGDFKIFSKIDRDSIDSGDAVSYKITIEGRGNIDDIDEIKLNIPHTTIYENPSNKQYNMKNNQYGGIYSKTFSIVATDNFTIPAITLQYFDKKSKTVKTIQTKSYDIKVKTQPHTNVKLEVASVSTKPNKKNIITQIVPISNQEKIIFFIFGLIFGILLVLVYRLYKNKTAKKDDKPIIRMIKKIKTQEKLFKSIIVYINIDENLDKLIYKLENKIDTKDFKIVKKEILKIFEILEKKDIKFDI